MPNLGVIPALAAHARLSSSTPLFPLNLYIPSSLHSLSSFALQLRKPARQCPAATSLCTRASSTRHREMASQPYQKPESPVSSPYGTWDSPITAALVSSGAMKLGGIGVGPRDRLFWVEGRPSEGGRGVVMMEGEAQPRPALGPGAGEQSRGLGPTPPATEPHGLGAHPHGGVEVSPPGMSAKSKVHEYGGGSFAVSEDLLVFCNQADQRIYMQDLSQGLPAPAVPITPEYPQGRSCVRYADFALDRRRGLVFCVREDHRPAEGHAPEEHAEPRNDLVAVGLEPTSPLAEPRVVASGADFYSFPRLSPDGCQLAWIQWDHPNMPWDRTSLWVGTLDQKGAVTDKRCIAGGEDAVMEAPTEPVWSPDGELFFVTDRNGGFWNIHRATAQGVEVVLQMGAEFSRPFWVFGCASFVFLPKSKDHMVCFYQQSGQSHLAVIDVRAKKLTPLTTPLTDCYILAAGKERLFVAGGSPSIAYSVLEVKLSPDLASCSLFPVWESTSLPHPSLADYFSQPSWVSFPAPNFPGDVSHAAFYAPHSPDYHGSGSGGRLELPPLLVRSHGGPTGATDTMLRLPIQYWTSRGWAVADVNYSGSAGYGRAFRERLYGRWGVADVADAQACVEYLVKEGLVDPARVATDGSSAGGFTCLAALTFTSTFRAGCSLYGISDLAALSAIMHKFESHYNDKLIGPLPEAAKLYEERSPIHHVDKLNCPVILFQGLEDKVVNPSQARMMYEAVLTKGLPVAIVEYEGEEHGFRKAENIEQTLEQEMIFFARVLLEVWTLPGISRELNIQNLSPPYSDSQKA